MFETFTGGSTYYFEICVGVEIGYFVGSFVFVTI